MDLNDRLVPGIGGTGNKGGHRDLTTRRVASLRITVRGPMDGPYGHPACFSAGGF